MRSSATDTTQPMVPKTTRGSQLKQNHSGKQLEKGAMESLQSTALGTAYQDPK